MAARKPKAEEKKDGELSSFEGRAVAGASIRVTNAGDGLSEALALEPQELHHGEEVWLVLHGKVSNVAFPSLKKYPDLLTRLHTVSAIECIMVAPDQVEGLLEKERNRLELIKEEKAGVTRLPMGDDPLNILTDVSDDSFDGDGNGDAADD